jgi:hypothetical protein
MGHLAQTGGQDFVLFIYGAIFVQNDHILTLYLAHATFDPDTGYPKILFGHRDIHFISQIFQFLKELIGLHDDRSHVFIIR